MSPSSSSSIFPFVFEPSGWLGNDGNWSVFTVQVGTPPQSFQVLPSTANGEVWVPVTEGCTWAKSISFDCGSSRGIGFFDGVQSSGFMSSDSSTWQQIGIYQLASEQNLFGNDTGLYGLDSVTIEALASTPKKLLNQTVAGIATWDFWLGSFGLSPQPAQFAVESTNIQSVLSSMKAQNLTPSLSFGYTAGASYRSSIGSLTIGGYDRSRVNPGAIQLLANDNTGDRGLEVSLRSLVATNTLQGTFSMPIETDNLVLAIDSTVSQLWLPTSMCDSLATAFGLTFESSAGLYLVNSTIHSQLISSNPEITMTIAANATSNVTTDIVFPYDAFDLEVGVPFYNGSAPYFPIRRAATGGQYTLGRTFLQEAYIAVDWERGNFSLGQAAHDASATRDIVPILSPSQTASGNQFGTGEIAGVVVGIVVAVTAIAVCIFFIRRHGSKKQAEGPKSEEEKPALEEFPEDPKPHPDMVAELGGEPQHGAEIMSTPIHELQDEQLKAQLMSTPVYELAGPPVGNELPEMSHSKKDTSQED